MLGSLAAGVKVTSLTPSKEAYWLLAVVRATRKPRINAPAFVAVVVNVKLFQVPAVWPLTSQSW